MARRVGLLFLVIGVIVESCSHGSTPAHNAAGQCADPKTGQAMPVGTSCDDGNLCNPLAFCDGKGACLTGYPRANMPTFDRNCATLTCNAGQFTVTALPDGTPCPDSSTCTMGACQAGKCTSSDPTVGVATTPCTVATCTDYSGHATTMTIPTDACVDRRVNSCPLVPDPAGPQAWLQMQACFTEFENAIKALAENSQGSSFDFSAAFNAYAACLKGTMYICSKVSALTGAVTGSIEGLTSHGVTLQAGSRPEKHLTKMNCEEVDYIIKCQDEGHDEYVECTRDFFDGLLRAQSNGEIGLVEAAIEGTLVTGCAIKTAVTTALCALDRTGHYLPPNSKGNLCSPGLTCCIGFCADLNSDPEVCGSCDVSCFAQPGQSAACCNGQCKDVNNDSSNCGSCGNVCPTGETCQSGTCTQQACGNPPQYCSAQEQCCMYTRSGAANGVCLDPTIDFCCPTWGACPNGWNCCATGCCMAELICCPTPGRCGKPDGTGC